MRSILSIVASTDSDVLAPRRLINAESVDHVLGQPHGHDEGCRQETASSTVRRSSAYPWVAVCRVRNVSVGAGSVCERRSVQRKLQQCIRARVSDVHVRSRRCAVRAVCSIRCVFLRPTLHESCSACGRHDDEVVIAHAHSVFQLRQPADTRQLFLTHLLNCRAILTSWSVIVESLDSAHMC
jgi:hypothetical protein